MTRSTASRFGSWIFHLPAALLCLAFATPAHAYIDLAPTLSKIIGDSQRISLVEVSAFNPDTHILTLKELRALKGDMGADPITHDVGSADGGVVPGGIVKWAEPGARAVAFLTRTTALVCFGEGWYQAKASGGEWKLGIDRADLPLAYYGTVSRLSDGIATMLAGGDAVLTMVQHGADDAASFDLALNRTNLPEVIRVQRIRANMKMPGMVMAMSANPVYVIGLGRVGQEEIPALLKQLGSTDAVVRAEAAEDLQQLGRKGQPAEPALEKLLVDPAVRVRIAVASAVLRIGGANATAIKILTDGLADKDAGVRRAAAEAVGRAGSAAGPLVGALSAVFKDSDFAARRSAVEAVATLGPVAAGAAAGLVPLLDDPKMTVEAADALGRIGPAAQPVPARLAALLGDDQPMAVRWAAVRAMAQIGGAAAHPAVDFIIKTLPSAQEIESYNMEIYLSLLGPVAADAIEVSQNTKLGHPVLPSATLWAIKASGLPWRATGRPGQPGFGGGGGGPGMGFDLVSTLYVAYFRELGERLRPVALSFLGELQAGTANDTPAWGYKLLACAPQEAIAQLSSALASSDLSARERAAVAFGYMGTAAYPARASLRTALEKAPTDREKRLLEWSLREIEAD